MPTHYKGTKPETQALNTYIKLMRAADALNNRLAPVFEKHGLTYSQFGVMEALYHLGPLCLGELAQKILRSGGNLTLVARNLERDGLIRRVASPEDRRVRRMELTARGKSLIERAFRDHVENLVRQMSTLSSAEQQDLGRLSKKLGVKLGIQTGGK
jgi:MarR family transcriptional regulator, 2-MHQ and catechol-resistance regulon repressor